MQLWGQDPSLPYFTANSELALLGFTVSPRALCYRGSFS